MKEIQIDEQNEGARLDKILIHYLNKAPKSFVYKMLRKKNILLNGKKAVGSEIVKTGDVICLYLADGTILKFQSDSTEKQSIYSLDEIKKLVCFEDDNIVAFQKPQGMLSQRSNSSDISLNDLLIAYLENDDPELFTPGISNRLDRNTSGIILAGKNRKASRCLNEVVKERWVDKHYLCPVKGIVTEPKTINAYLSKDENSNFVSVYSVPMPEAKQIVTRYEPISHNSRVTLLDVDLVTGKSHQIRAHLAYLSHPIVGDRKYGDKILNQYFCESYGLRDQLLHAYKVIFHDIKNDLSYLNGTKITAEVPIDFNNILKGEGLWLPGTAED